MTLSPTARNLEFPEFQTFKPHRRRQRLLRCRFLDNVLRVPMIREVLLRGVYLYFWLKRIALRSQPISL
jgi:hypothetical protein